MNEDRFETVWRAIQATLDGTGHGTASRRDLALASGVSEATVKRAIKTFVDDKRIVCVVKDGRSGGYLFGPQTGSTGSAKPGQPGQPGQAMPCLSQPGQGASPSDPDPVGVAATGSTGSADGAQAKWFICCIWYDEKGAMWAHGQDGYPTYIPCESKEAAMEMAEEHQRLPHRSRPGQRTSFPNVDVCEELFNGKQLHYRYVAVKPGLA